MSATSKKPRALVCHPWMGLGGSELVTAWVLQALSQDHELHLCTASGFNPAKWNAAAGTSLVAENIKWIQAPPLPGASQRALLPHWHRARFERYCRTIAPDFDLLVSGYNPIAFGKPALHVIGDTRWQQQFNQAADDWSETRRQSRLVHRLHEGYRALVNALYYRKLDQRFDKKDWFLSNSRWTMEKYQKWAPQVHHELVYPPVPGVSRDALPAQSTARNTGVFEFVTLGRVSREKRIEESIAILEKVRSQGHEVTLSVIGSVGEDAYGKELQTLAEARPWVHLTGPLYGEEKIAVLERAGFGIQACRVEAFGIAVAELAYHGCLTWVPSDSGSVEVISNPQFHFDSVEKAATQIVQVLQAGREPQERWREEIRRHARENFSPENFVGRFRECLQGFS